METPTNTNKTENKTTSANSLSGIENHKKAAAYHQEAAKFHLEAVKQHEAGNETKASDYLESAKKQSALACDCEKADTKLHELAK